MLERVRAGLVNRTVFQKKSISTADARNLTTVAHYFCNVNGEINLKYLHSSGAIQQVTVN